MNEDLSRSSERGLSHKKAPECVQALWWALQEKTWAREPAPVWFVSLHMGAFCDRIRRKASRERLRDSSLKSVPAVTPGSV